MILLNKGLFAKDVEKELSLPNFEVMFPYHYHNI